MSINNFEGGIKERKEIEYVFEGNGFKSDKICIEGEKIIEIKGNSMGQMYRVILDYVDNKPSIKDVYFQKPSHYDIFGKLTTYEEERIKKSELTIFKLRVLEFCEMLTLRFRHEEIEKKSIEDLTKEVSEKVNFIVSSDEVKKIHDEELNLDDKNINLEHIIECISEKVLEKRLTKKQVKIFKEARNKLEKQRGYSFYLGEVAKIFGIGEVLDMKTSGEKKLFSMLREKGVLKYNEDEDNVPIRKFIENGCFILDYSQKKDGRGRFHYVPKATLKGVKFILDFIYFWVLNDNEKLNELLANS